MTVWLVVAVPAAAGVAVAVAGRRHGGLAGWLAFCAMAATAGLGLAASVGQAGATWPWGGGLTMQLATTGPARLIVVLVPAIALPVVAYAAEEHRDDRGLGRLLGLLCGFVAAMEVLVVAADFLSLLFAWELVGAFSWALIAYDWRVPDHPQRAAQAFITTRFGDLGLYLAAGGALSAAGGRSLAFSAMPHRATTDLAVVGGGLLFAAAAKSAQLPFSPWLFSAMAGPTPVSALLH
jgi:NADH:ubiquinone oxidoreductase subunit 5 (subunit L)/multisubunit Na+/H+ antiporter MnhA subunit